MHRSALIPNTFLSLLLLLTPPTTAQSSSPKRGLCHITKNSHPADDQIWLSGPSNPTWYYNYASRPSPAYTSTPSLQFVPMLWGASASDTGAPFYDTVVSQLDAGANISFVLGFNEPDASFSVGGSNVDVGLAARRWKAEIEPLRELGVRVGAPAVTGSRGGMAWMEGWLEECGGGCRPDFVPVHWYGEVEGMARWVGEVAVKFPQLPIWVTEFGYPDQSLDKTQAFWNLSASMFDSWP